MLGLCNLSAVGMEILVSSTNHSMDVSSFAQVIYYLKVNKVVKPFIKLA